MTIQDGGYVALFTTNFTPCQFYLVSAAQSNLLLPVWVVLTHSTTQFMYLLYTAPQYIATVQCVHIAGVYCLHLSKGTCFCR